ncbi:MAG: hypothetical protein ABI210_03130 [Abditibacteriaceae bacterium]
MREFQYFSPSQDDQRAFIMQLLGAFLGLIVVAVLFWMTSAFELRAVLIGAGVAIVWMLGNAAWRLEKKARRSQLAGVGFDDDHLFVTDWHGLHSKILWGNVTSCEVKGGRLLVAWDGGKLHVGARELEDGMDFVQHVAKKVHGDKSTFIALTPREPSSEPAHSLRNPRSQDADNPD